MKTPGDFLSHLQMMTEVSPGQKWQALCPCHNDHNPSLDIKLAEDGRSLLVLCRSCRANGAAVCKKLGIPESSLFLDDGGKDGLSKIGLMVADLCVVKKFPEERARKEWGFEDGFKKDRQGRQYPVVKIPYWRQDGSFFRYRVRQSLIDLGDFKRFVWEGEVQDEFKTIMYGLWRQPESREFLILVEGESDVQTLWLADYPALGFPGASQYKPKRDDVILKQYKRLYVHIEKDTGGATLYRSLVENGGEILDRIKFFTLQGYKDPSEMWQKLTPDDFKATMRNRLATAVPASQFDMSKVVPADVLEAGKKKKGEGKADGQQDGRAASSPVNGLKGGRPKADYLGAADGFYRETLSDGRRYRFAAEKWFGYVPARGRYAIMRDSGFEAVVRLFLQRSFKDGNPFNIDATRNALGNVVDALKTTDYCVPEIDGGAEDGVLMCNRWLDLPDVGGQVGAGEVGQGRQAGLQSFFQGKDPERMFSCKNGIIDLNRAGEMLAAGASPDVILENCLCGHTPCFFTLEALPYPFTPSARWPKWEAYPR